jgi:hypothetical protein
VDEILRDARRMCGDATIVSRVYHTGLEEAGPGKMFDFLQATISDGWNSGRVVMRRALPLIITTEGAKELAARLGFHEVKSVPERRHD